MKLDYKKEVSKDIHDTKIKKIRYIYILRY